MEAQGPCVIALGTTDKRILELVTETTARYQLDKGLDLWAQFSLARTADEQLTGISNIAREACLRAQLIRKEKNAVIGVAGAIGRVQFLYNRGARKVTFTAHFIASVCSTGPITIAAPSNCPDEAFDVYNMLMQKEMERYYKSDDVIPDHIGLLAEIAVGSWSEMDFPRPDACIEFMQ